MQAKHVRTGSQIVFDDAEGSSQYKSLYLDTLGPQAVRRSFADRVAHDASSSCLPVEGYAHGMGTADISGASPAVHSLTRAAAARHQAGKFSQDRPDEQSAAAAAAAAGYGSSDGDADAGMRPRIRHPQTVNRPDLIHSTLDIDGAQPHCRNIFQHPRKTDPLNPCYKLSDGPTLPLPSGPAPADKYLGDPLDVTDIVGACSKQQQRPCTRPGQLDVSDIVGANAAWRPHHRQHVGLAPRDAGLAVHDINSYMARFKPAARASANKGHPEGPRMEPRLKPRLSPAMMDNSLRTLDIEGTRAVPAGKRKGMRQPHNHTTSVADIEGTAPADRDKVHLFERKKAAAAALLADQAAAQAVLSGLELSPQDLAALWGNCRQRDKDGSGYLTAKELEGAMQAAQLQLPAADAQRLLAALQDNAGLLDYKKLTKQLKGRVSRPGSAKQQQEQQQQSYAVCQGQGQQLAEQGQQRHAPTVQYSATMSVQGAVAVPDVSDASRCAADALERQHTSEGGGSAGCWIAASAGGDQQAARGRMCGAAHTAVEIVPMVEVQQRARPQTAPPRACSAFGHHAAVAAGSSSSSSKGSSNSSEYKAISHWFGGSSRDKTMADGVAKWRPGQTASLLSSMQPSSSSASVEYCAAAAFQVPHVSQLSSRCQARPSTQQQQQQVMQRDAAAAAGAADVVPGWMVGADPLHGTFHVVQPFGEGISTTSAAAAARQSSAHKQRPGSSCGGRCSPAVERPTIVHRRPASAGPCCRGRSSSRSSGVAVVTPAAMKVVGCRWGADGGASVLGVPGGSGNCISSQWLCSGATSEQSCQQQHAWQHNARPQSAGAAVRQRPASPAGHAASFSSSSSSSSGGVISLPCWSPQQQRTSRPAAAYPAMPASAGGNAGSLTGNGVCRPANKFMGRPSSCPPHSVTSGVGHAENRRLAESTRQDLTAVRLLQ